MKRQTRKMKRPLNNKFEKVLVKMGTFFIRNYKVKYKITLMVNKAMSKKNRFDKLFDTSKYIYILAVLIFITGIGLAAWFAYGSVSANNNENVVDETPIVVGSKDAEEDCNFRRKLDGVCVELEKQIDPDLIAIMVENNLEAWPLSGITKAQVVYEAPVEGNIPRYMLIYTLDTEDVEKVGPVRSARPYYLDWVSEYGRVMYMHVGGSPEALEAIDNFNIFDLNEMNRGWYYWRSEDRTAPHNTYTSNKLWTKAFNDYNKYSEDSDYDGWVFDKQTTCVEDCVTDIRASFSSANAYKAGWVYNAEKMQYVRYQGTKKVEEDDGGEIFADTIIVQRVKAKVVDDIGRKEIETVGNGEAVIFRDGKVFEGTWEKKSRKDRTQWYDKEGKPIGLKAGKIWIEILPDTMNLKWE